MPYNSPMKKKGSACMQLKDYKGKPSGLMMEGSVAYQESVKQEKENLEGPEAKNPVDDKASAMEMSPYKMDHSSALHKEEDKKPLQTYKGSEFDPDEKVEGEVVVTGKRQGPSGEIVEKGGVKYRKIGNNLYPIG